MENFKSEQALIRHGNLCERAKYLFRPVEKDRMSLRWLHLIGHHSWGNAKSVMHDLIMIDVEDNINRSSSWLVLFVISYSVFID